MKKELASLSNRTDGDLSQTIVFQVQLSTVSKRLVDVLTSCQLMLKLGQTDSIDTLTDVPNMDE